MERARSLPLACPKYFHASPWFEGKNGGLVVVERRRARQEGRKPVISPAESALPSRVGRWPGLAELGGLASLGASDRRAPVPAAADSGGAVEGGSRAPAHHHYCSAASHNPSFQLTTTAELTFQPELANPLSLRHWLSVHLEIDDCFNCLDVQRSDR